MTRFPHLILAGALATVLTVSGQAGAITATSVAAATTATAACTAALQQHAAATASAAAAAEKRTKKDKELAGARKAFTRQATARTRSAITKAVFKKHNATRQLKAARAIFAATPTVVQLACATTNPSPGAPGDPGSPGSPGTIPAPPVADPARPQDPVAHDPTVVKEGEWYYLAITGDTATGRDYLPMKRSKDLLHWEHLPPVFTTLPAEIVAAVPDVAPPNGVGAEAPKDAWAPDLSWTGSEWRLYYSASRFGTTNSVTALATSKTLDPDSADYGWVDQGIVLETEPGAAYNAIDANYVQDAQGNSYLTFGSFFAGLQMVALDASTGKVAAGAAAQTIAKRPINFNPIEGPSMIRNGDYYYLFASFDYCCRGAESDYRIVVGRSKTITGPYVDQAGVPMLEGGGTEVLRGYNEFQGTGHPDVFSSGGVDYFVNHYYDRVSNGTPRLNVRTLSWGDGWPTVSDPVNPSRSAGHGSAYVQVIPRDSGAAVGTVDCGYAGANVALTDSVPTSSCQQWQIDARDAKQVTDGSETGSRFQNRNANMAVDFPGCAEAESIGNIGQFDWLGNFFYNICQRWVFSPAPDGYTTVTSIAGRHLAWTAQGLAPGSNLGVATSTGAADQQFRFQPSGDVLLGGPGDPTQTLGVEGCTAAAGDGSTVRLQTRAVDSCQAWTMTPTGGAGFTVTNAAAGRPLASSGCLSGTTDDTLRLVSATSREPECRTWTLVPGDDGTWSLATLGNSRTVRLLIP